MIEESCNLRFAISVVTIWGEACPHAHRHTHTVAQTVCLPHKTLPPSNRAYTQTHTHVIILYDYASTTPKRKATHIQRYIRTHASLCTWLNVTVRHILIC